MKEIILQNKKHGMRTLLICIALELLAIAGCIWFAEYANKAAKSLSTTTTDYTNASLIYF